MKPVCITAATMVTAVGAGLDAHADALRRKRSGLVPCDLPGVDLDTWIGRVQGVDAVHLDGSLSAYECRNHRLALLGLEHDGFSDRVKAAVARHGKDRVGVFMGTSTSGIAETERAYAERHGGALPDWFDFRRTQSIHALGEFIRERFNLSGVGHTVSTACSSSAKAVVAAVRHLACGLCDSALVGGADSLCLTTLYGFHSLELTSPEPCRPFDAGRQGISIGEAAGFVLLERGNDVSEFLIAGWGESSDGHHMSTPHPEGLGAAAAIRQALSSSGLAATEIDYVNLHGTGTLSNDRAEDRAIRAVFGNGVRCAGTKGYTGHTLGAAGIVELILSMLSLREGLVPGTCQTRRQDPDLGVHLCLDPEPRPVRHVLSNSFGFGGSNCSLVISRQ